MKFNSFFLLIISLATVPSLVNIHPASAGRCLKCGVIGPTGSIHGRGTLPPEVSQKVDALKAQGNFAGAEGALLQFKEQAERTQDLNGQAAAYQALADVYVSMGKSELVPDQLNSAEALFQRSGNSAGFRDVQIQRRQIQLQQIQLQPR
ncbi:hypothetical protein C7B82_12765 [Stenomitos frigidus ULC18]|uniref:Uncharacterized protein n=2 Tax=Stenomitos TaxID=1844270 RepID=A0A2T1E7L5_9CYAN|nr:hypothetical protein C7B82_12765 [Stenomitos frigidus ULC18]